MLKMEIVLLEYTGIKPPKSTIDSEDQCKKWKEYENKLKILSRTLWSVLEKKVKSTRVINLYSAQSKSPLWMFWQTVIGIIQRG